MALSRASLSTCLCSLLLPLVLGCSKNNPQGVADGGGNGSKPGIVGACVSPNTGCACDEPGRSVSCGQVVARSEQYVSCSMGHRTCGDDGKWGECIGNQVITLNKWQAPGVSAQAQPAGVAAPTDCDPYLYQISGDVTDYPTNTGVETNMDGGVQLKQVTGTATACPMGTTLSITPSTSPATDLVITTVATPPSPNTVQFDVSLPACAGSLTPIWTVDQPTYATISSTGLMTLQYPYVGPINVTAYVGDLSATVVSNVTVSAVDSSQVTNGSTIATEFLTTCSP